jgi:hypothetical protein
VVPVARTAAEDLYPSPAGGAALGAAFAPVAFARPEQIGLLPSPLAGQARTGGASWPKSRNRTRAFAICRQRGSTSRWTGLTRAWSIEQRRDHRRGFEDIARHHHGPPDQAVRPADPPRPGVRRGPGTRPSCAATRHHCPLPHWPGTRDPCRHHHCPVLEDLAELLPAHRRVHGLLFDCPAVSAPGAAQSPLASAGPASCAPSHTRAMRSPADTNSGLQVLWVM